MTGIERTLQLKNFLVYNFVFWVVLCLWEIVKTFSFSVNYGVPYQMADIIRWPVANYLAYWILSYLVFDVYQKTNKLRRPAFLFYHFIASLIFSLIHKIFTGVAGLLLERLFLELETKTWSELITLFYKSWFDMAAGVFVYWLILLIITGLDFYRRFNDQNTKRLELEGALGKAQLKSMKMQMNPHFLFNAFNTISMMVRQKKSDEAVEMIGGLSDMFRQSLNKELKQFVDLEEEIDLLKKYLAIESTRYKDRLVIEWEIDDDTLKYEVPNFVLQPIVENAFKHGISKTLADALLKISIREKEGLLHIEVFNTGSGLPMNWELQKDKGVGLANTIDRMLKLYEEAFQFVIEEHDDGVSVILKLPIQMKS